jgi:N-acetylglucosamine-6-sulfatase
MKFTPILLLTAILFTSCNSNNSSTQRSELEIQLIKGSKPRSVIFILSDDHRYDFMGKVPWLKTPSLDRLAKEGAYFRNTFVTTALCSPSRASILTGLYSHTHKVVDNQAPLPPDLIIGRASKDKVFIIIQR